MKWEKPKHWLRQKKVKAVIASTALVFALLAAQPTVADADIHVGGKRYSNNIPVCSIVCLPAGMGLILPPAGSSSIIQSIQEVSVTATTATTGDATISSVSTSNAHLVWSGNTTTASATTFINSGGYVELTSTTNVRVTRSGTSGNITANCYVVEFTSGTLNSVQQGTIALTANASTATAAISSVTTTNSAIYYLGLLNPINTTDDLQMPYCSITSATQVTLTRGASGTDDLTIGFVVSEYASGKLNSSTQQFTVALNNTITSNTATLSAITVNQTAIAYGGTNTTSAATQNFTRITWGQLTSTTQFTGTRTTGSFVSTLAGTAVEYKSANINGIDRGSIDIATSSSTGDVTIGAVTLAKTIAASMGQSSTVNAGDPRNKLQRLSLTSTTNLRSTLNTTNVTAVGRLGYEVVEFI
jgi:hypothetical protein